MCPGCDKFWTALQVVWSTIYVICGAAQLISGIFFMISIPALHLSCNIWTGSWNVIIGIVGGMLACMVRLSPRRQEFLLYMAVSILTVNSVNVVLSEWGLYFSDMSELLRNHPSHMLIDYACFATRVAAAAVVVTAFLDTQFAFCSMQIAPNPLDKKKLHGSHDQVSDIEYIIPRPKSSKPHTTVYNAYSQSWVFESDSASCSNNVESPYLKILENGTPQNRKLQNGGLSDTTHLIDNPVVHVEEASDDSNSNSDRKLCHMRSFSRSASPVLVSESSSHISLHQSNPPIYDCLETIYRSRLNSGSREEPHYQAPQAMVMKRVESISPHAEKVQYASLMKELQSAIVHKKEPPSVTSPQSSEETKDSSDAEFSKELEAALQLIQDLESPNTIDTPSEKAASPPQEFKGKAPGSQSTSGYSSPDGASWSTTSSLNVDVAYSIRTGDTATVISLYSQPPARGKSVTLVNIGPAPKQGEKWSVRSLLRRKKEVPRLCPELEGAIVKSESLAYLSELELLARYRRNEEIQREIEERVIQQLGTPRTESNC